MSLSEEVIKSSYEKVRREVCLARCRTCRKVFLDITVGEYYEKHSYDSNRPDRWWCNAALHWLESGRNHNLVVDTPVPLISDLSMLFQKWYDNEFYKWGSDEALTGEVRRYLLGANVEI